MSDNAVHIDVLYGLATSSPGAAFCFPRERKPSPDEPPRAKLPPLKWLAYWVRYLLTGKTQG